MKYITQAFSFLKSENMLCYFLNLGHVCYQWGTSELFPFSLGSEINDNWTESNHWLEYRSGSEIKLRNDATKYVVYVA
jgi:hypothetical protein